MNDKRASVTPFGFGAVLLAFLAALLGVKLGGDGERTSPRPIEEKTQRTDSSRSNDTPSHRAFLRSYLDSLTTCPAKKGENSGPTIQEGEGDRIECLIASVPDPVDTPFGFWFDQVVESLTRVAAEVHYAPAGHWFPWELYRIAAGNSSGKESGSANSSTHAQVPLFASCPGMMLFRNQKTPERTLVVMLVGETANGIKSQALQDALSIAREIDEARTEKGKAHQIRLLAPFFSGAQAPLYFALRQWAQSQCDDKISFDLITGSANGLNLSLPATIFQPSIRYRVRSTIIPSDVQRTAALQFLKCRDVQGEIRQVDASAVAILVESNTGFGQNQMPKNGEPKEIYLPYPMNLSRVRTRYAHQRVELERQFRPGDLWLLDEKARREPRPNPDTVTSLDRSTTPRLVDRAADDITATIRRNRIRYVGIEVTDPEDVIFFVERIKRDCPNVNLFVVGMDLLYALPENRQTMRGVVVSSTYPLFPPNQEWTNPDQRVRETFQSESVEGYYNAAVFHLARLMPDPEKNESEDDFKRRTLREYAPPVFSRNARCEDYLSKPPAWVFSIGENGRYVPHGLFGYPPIPVHKTDQQDLMARAPIALRGSGDRAIDRPRLGTFLVPVTLLLLMAVGVLVWVVRQAAAPEPLSAPSVVAPRKGGWRPIASWFWIPMGELQQRSGPCHTLVLMTALIGVSALLFTLHILLGPSFHTTHSWSWLVISFANAIAWGLLLGVLFVQFRLLLRYGTVPPSERIGLWGARFVVMALLLVGSLAFAGWLLVRYWADDATVHILFAERVVNMLTGYSVLAPLLLLAVGVLGSASFALQRHYLARHYQIECPYPDLSGRGLCPTITQTCHKLRQLSDTLRKDLTSFNAFRSRHGSVLLAAAVIYGIGLVLIGYHAQPGFEGRAWDLLFLTAFAGLTGSVVLDTTRFLVLWKELEQLLKQIVLLPMVRAFDRLPRKIADLFGGYLLTRRPRASHIVILMHLLRQLQHEAADDSASGIVDHLKQRTAWPDLEGATYDEEYPGNQLSVLSKDAQVLIAESARHWPHHSVQNAFGEPPASEAETSTAMRSLPTDRGSEPIPPWIKTAEDFVAIQAIVFLSQYFIQLRKLAAGMVWASVMLMLATTVYPFQPEHLILYAFLCLLLFVSGSLVWVLIRVNKNEMVSRITRSTPNRFELNWQFAGQLVLYVGPILLVLIAQLSGRLRVLVEPFLNVIR